MNSPCWLEKNERIKNNNEVDILEENFTYMYYNFMKFGLVDEVFILPREDYASEENIFKTSAGNINIVDKEKFSDLSAAGGNIIYCWLNWEQVNPYSENNFVIVNPMMNNILHPNKLQSQHHHFALLESPLMRNTLPGFLSKKWEALPLINTNSCTRRKCEESPLKYDFVSVSSMDSRKRVFELIKNLNNHARMSDRSYKIAICTWDPDKCSGNDKIKNYNLVREIVENNDMISIEFFFDCNSKEIKSVLDNSKIFVSTSNFDNGPRAVFEALQTGIPVLTTQIGASSYVTSGFNGEIVNEEMFHKIPRFIDYMIEREQNKSYEARSIEYSRLLTPESLFPSVCDRIKREYKLKFSK